MKRSVGRVRSSRFSSLTRRSTDNVAEAKYGKPVSNRYTLSERCFYFASP